MHLVNARRDACRVAAADIGEHPYRGSAAGVQRNLRAGDRPENARSGNAHRWGTTAGEELHGAYHRARAASGLRAVRVTAHKPHGRCGARVLTLVRWLLVET